MLALAPMRLAAQAAADAPVAPDVLSAAPTLQNRDAVIAAFQQNYPPELHAIGIGGRALVRVLVDRQGRPAQVEVVRSSSFPPMDSAALRVAAAMRFLPARQGASAVATWVQLPVAFTPGLPEGEKATVPRGSKVSAPKLANREEIQQVLRQHCTSEEARGRGTVRVFVGGDGTPKAAELTEPSGNAAVDRAMTHAALVLRFEPARLASGAPVGVWVNVPIFCADV